MWLYLFFGLEFQLKIFRLIGEIASYLVNFFCRVADSIFKELAGSRRESKLVILSSMSNVCI